MSEYQYVHFLALDQPLDDKQLAYMETQSSRAEITKRAFTNEYHYGDFRGNAKEMLRRGYDVHLHYANFGVRTLMFRLPAGLPWSRKMFDKYLPEYGVTWHPDKQGPGGILEIQPESDAGTFDYQANLGQTLELVAPVRELLIAGDLRPLYVIWLAMTAIHGDDEAMEPPLPAGMVWLPDCLTALADLYELRCDLLQAAAEGSPPLPKSTEADSRTTAWLARRSENELKKLLERVLAKDTAGVRAETLALIRDESGTTTWPTAESTRTFQELRELGEELEKSPRLRRNADAKEKARRTKLKKLAADPEAAINQIESLVGQRSKSNYIKAAESLVELREALGPKDGPMRVQAVAERLRMANPTLRVLISELRKHGLLGKAK